jgi:hypothetical protein
MSIAGKISQKILTSVFKNDQLVKTFDQIQGLVFDSPFNNLGTPTASATPSDTSIPITINGTQYYLKLSTTP